MRPENLSAKTDDPLSDGMAFTLKLGRALQGQGVPAHRLEEAMREVVDTMGVEGEFFSTPTVLLVAIMAVALVTGLLISNAIVPPGKKF
ncbi:MAG TPA: threonine/serine exporter family protein [Thermoanaerobaculia bacterium]|nr:threonine/serine exporter family protein [Thermoanaerobaculia bacterium]